MLLANLAGITVAGEKHTVTIPSRHIQRCCRAIVVLPDAYEANDTQRYNVIYLLHGWGRDAGFWPSLVNLGEYADRYGVVFVCPQGGNSWYIDSPIKSESRFESYMVDEVVPWIDSNYSTDPRVDSRAIIGSSMGGYGALRLFMRHQDVFGAVGSISGIIDPSAHYDKWNLEDILGDYTLHASRWQRYRIDTLAMHHAIATDALMIIDCGNKDRLANFQNRALHELLLTRDIPHIYREGEGRHRPSYVQQACGYHFAIVAAHMRKGN